MNIFRSRELHFFSISKAFFLILALKLSAEFGVRNFDESIRVVKLRLNYIIEDTNAAEVVKISSGTIQVLWLLDVAESLI